MVTRKASAFEANEPISRDAFARALAYGVNAMHREAHGHCYGLPRAFDDDIRAGRTVIVNVSRTVIGAYAPVPLQRRRGLYYRAAAGARRAACDALSRQRRQAGANRLGCKVEDAAAAPDVTIMNVSTAEYHARQLVRVIKGERWDE